MMQAQPLPDLLINSDGNTIHEATRILSLISRVEGSHF